MAKSKIGYVDGFVLVVPKAKREVYKKMAKDGAKMWIKAGALDYKECVGDDLAALDTGGMKALTFTKIAKPKDDEEVWFSYVSYKSRAHRDQVNKKVVSEMAKDAAKYKDFSMPFDAKRMAYGGFKVIVSN